LKINIENNYQRMVFYFYNMTKRFNNLIDKNIAYLKSEEFKIREDSFTTKYLLKNLIKINKLGILTIDSQIGVKTKIKDVIINERSYIIGFMLKDKSIELKKNFTLTDKIMMILPIISIDKLPIENDIPLTVEQNLLTKEITIITHMSIGIPKKQLIFELEQYGLDKLDINDINMVLIFDPVWNRKANNKNGLFSFIESL
jgi:hypothetical protein